MKSNTIKPSQDKTVEEDRRECFLFGHIWEKDCDWEECKKDICSRCKQQCMNAGGEKVMIYEK